MPKSGFLVSKCVKFLLSLSVSALQIPSPLLYSSSLDLTFMVYPPFKARRRLFENNRK